MKDERIVWLMLIMIFGTGNPRIWSVSRDYDSADEFYCALKEHRVNGLNDREKQLVDKVTQADAQKILDNCAANGINVYCYESEGYPQRLGAIADPPAVLFSYGNLDFLNHISTIAVVGTRQPSEYSVETAKWLCNDMLDKDITLCSGFANGIDQIANVTSLDRGKPTVAVCGTALDHDYPSGSMELKKKIGENGVVISEHIPGTKAFQNAFKLRNRILVGISQGVVFIEASRESHGLDNFTHATAQGKPVFVVPPCDITDKRYFGQRYLLRNDCIPLFNADDIVGRLALEGFDSFAFTKDFGDYSLPVEDSQFYTDNEIKQRLSTAESKPKAAPKKQNASEKKEHSVDYAQLDENESAVCKVLEEGRALADTICVKTGLDISVVLSTLTMLELEGIVNSLPGNQFELAN